MELHETETNETEQMSSSVSDPRREAVVRALITTAASRADVLAEAGVTEAEYLGWVADGTFPAEVASLAKRWAEAEAPFVWRDLLALTRSGSVPAMRLFFDLSGKRTAEKSTSPYPYPSAQLEALRADIFGAENGGDDA